MDEKETGVYEIDIFELVVMLIKKWWIIALASILGVASMFAYTRYFITPLYQTSIMLYINNSSISIGSTKLNLSSGDLAASQELVNTYGVILQSNLTLSDVADAVNANSEIHREYTYKELAGMIDSSAANDTEIMKVTVTAADYQDAVTIANTIAEVLPKRISRIVEGTSVTIVDLAEYPTAPSSPSYQKNMLMGFAVGFILACAAILIYNIFIHDTIDSEDYIRNSYGDALPILAVVPEIGIKSKSFYQSKYYSKYGYYSTVDIDEKKSVTDQMSEEKGGKSNE